MISLSSLIHRKIVVLSHHATIQDAARALRENRIGCALISGPDAYAAGIVTDRDLACYWGTDSPARDRTVDEIMSRELIAAGENSGLPEIIQLMETHGVRRIPILSEEKDQARRRFVGLVTLDDLIAGGLIDAPRIARIVRRQIGQRVLARERPHPPHIATPRTEARAEAHKLQSLQRFQAAIAAATGLAQESVPEVSRVILGSLVMRVSLTTAMHFIAQLPELIREPLMDLPPGPNRAISPRSIVEELVKRFRYTENFARTLLQRFVAALAPWITPGQLGHLRAQLPEEFGPYFEAPAEPRPEAPPRGSMSVTSPSFAEGGDIPRQYTAEGGNRSPRIEWSGIPQGTKEFALICEDPPTVNWVVYGISGSVTEIPEGNAPLLARQGTSTTGSLGYAGPFPPEKDDWHRYRFHLYALDREIALPPGAPAEELRQEMKGHILAEGTLTGRYRRARRIAA